MELDTIKQSIFQWIGQLSVVTGLLSLAFLNIFLLWGYHAAIGDNFSIWIYITIILGVISTFNKKSRRLGLWGLGLGLYLGLFVVVMFLLSWVIYPFP